MAYPFKEIEQKWQEAWFGSDVYHASNTSEKPKFFALIEFPYPSAEGLHVGHPRSYTAMDVIARKRRMEGYNVLFPIGWDAFGLPAENYAIKTGEHPKRSTERNVANFKRQLRVLGFSFDWSREINTTDPAYYKWTQWIFLQMFKKGLAYKADVPINWCTSCKVGLANEEVVNGACERCGSDVVKKNKNQWMLRITQYADRLIEDLDTVDYLEKIKAQQINWIGKSHGAEIDFVIPAINEKVTVFTTRPDTLFGATYLTLAPEHSLVERLDPHCTNPDEVVEYRNQAMYKSDLERTELAKEKTGVPLEGVFAVNPATGKEIPVWVADYVLMGYGTGAIMAVPGHDSRDYEFAKTFDLPIVEVISGGDLSEAAHEGDGTLVNSDFLDGLGVADAKQKMTAWLEEKGLGRGKVNYKLRDWVFSRQRYWGECIPVVHCEKCGWVAVPESELPVVLPEVESFQSKEEGLSVLEGLTDWVNTTCPDCGGPARRETDTMPQWAGSSWYFLRYTDAHNDEAFASQEALKYWTPVDWYNGGMEHTTLHLLYSRFWHKFLYDEGHVPTSEPYARRTSHGMILGSDGEKMSKSRGNVVNPDEIVDQYGADTFRAYEMFIGAFDQTAQWSTEGLNGVARFLNRVWNVMEKVSPDAPMAETDTKLMHRTIKHVDERIESMKFNTAVAELMSYTSELLSKDAVPVEMFRTLCLLLHPVAPHQTCEMWERSGIDGELVHQSWPQFDPALAAEDEVTIAVQINGKLRDTVTVPVDTEKEEIERLAMQSEKVTKHTEGKTVVKVIYVPGKILNIVVKG